VRVLTFSKQHGRESAVYLTFSDFRNLYMNRFIVIGKDKEGNEIKMPLGKWWLNNPRRRQYEGVIFAPQQGERVQGKLNLWRGWGVQPKPGNWELMAQHLFEVLAGSNEEYEAYILNFAAWCVQHPDAPAEVAVVFKGPEGSGRGIFARALCRIFGQHAV